MWYCAPRPRYRSPGRCRSAAPGSERRRPAPRRFLAGIAESLRQLLGGPVDSAPGGAAEVDREHGESPPACVVKASSRRRRLWPSLGVERVVRARGSTSQHGGDVDHLVAFCRASFTAASCQRSRPTGRSPRHVAGAEDRVAVATRASRPRLHPRPLLAQVLADLGRVLGGPPSMRKRRPPLVAVDLEAFEQRVRRIVLQAPRRCPSRRALLVDLLSNVLSRPSPPPPADAGGLLTVRWRSLPSCRRSARRRGPICAMFALLEENPARRV